MTALQSIALDAANDPALLDRVREGHATTPLLLISPIFCPLVEDHAGPTIPVDGGKAFTVLTLPPESTVFSLTRQKIRATLAAIVEARRLAGDANLWFLDGLELLGPADEHLLHDRLHPDETGYRLLGERFERLVFGEGGALAPA